MRMKEKMMVWTWTSPFTPSGSPSILRKLMLNFEGKNILYISGKDERNNVAYAHPISHKNLSSIDKIYHKIGPIRLKVVYDIIIKIPLLTIIGIFNVIKFKPDFILTVYVLPEWIYSAWLISKITRKPLFYYCHDPHKEKYKFKAKWQRNINARIEKRTLKDSHVIALYDGLAELYKAQYQIDVMVIPHTASRKIKNNNIHNKKEGHAIKIGFAGSIYDNNIGLMKNLIEVTHKLNLHLVLFGNYFEETLEEIDADKHENLVIRFVNDYDELIVELGKVDLLFLPLSFEETVKVPRACLKYVIPTKAIDYLISDRPILVNCPEDFELYKFFEKHQAAYLLQSNKIENLDSLLNKFTEGQLKEIPQSNINNALNNFDENSVNKKFRNYIVDKTS